MENDPVILVGKTDDEIIDFILSRMYKRKNYSSTIREMIVSAPNEQKQAVKDKLFVRGLVVNAQQQLTSYRDNIRLTDESIRILSEYGSYLSFLASKRRVEIQTTAKSIVPIIIAIASFIWAVYMGALNYTKGEEIKRKDSIIKTQSETIELMKHR